MSGRGLKECQKGPFDAITVNLNGSIVANKGFIALMAPVGSTVIEAKWVSAWGGIQSAGQCIGQMFIAIVSERLGRRVALGAFWIMMIIVSLSVWYIADAYSLSLLSLAPNTQSTGSLQSSLPVSVSARCRERFRCISANTARPRLEVS